MHPLLFIRLAWCLATFVFAIWFMSQPQSEPPVVVEGRVLYIYILGILTSGCVWMYIPREFKSEKT